MRAAVLCALLALPAAAFAEAKSVELVVIAPKQDATLVDSVRELLGRLGLVVSAHPASDEKDAARFGKGAAAARVEVDLRAEDRATIAIDTAGGVVRRSVSRAASPSVAREEIAHAVQTAVESQLFPRPAPPPAPPPTTTTVAAPPPAVSAPVEIAPPPIRESPPVAAPRSPYAFDVAVRAGAGGFSDATGPNARIGGSVRFAYRSALSPSILFGVDYAPPVESAARNDVSGRASAVLLRTMVEIAPLRTRGFALLAGVGGGLDAITVEPRTTALPASYLMAATTRVAPIASASLTAQLALAPSVALSFIALADVDLGPTQRYVVDVMGSNDVVLTPWRVRPALLAGITFTPYGPGAFRR